MKVSLAEHERLIEAFRRKDASGAESLMRRHIRHVRHGVMENIKFFLGHGEKNLPE
jgi:DNA-binding GntR family transcriptional regulator